MLDYPRFPENSARSSAAEKAPAPGPLSFFGVWTPTADKFGDGAWVGKTITQDWLKFVADRMWKDMSFPQQLAACKTIDDVYVLYREFWQQAARDYSAECTAIGNFVWNAMRSPASCSSAKGESCGHCDRAKSAV